MVFVGLEHLHWKILNLEYTGNARPSSYHTELLAAPIYANNQIEIAREWTPPADLSQIKAHKISLAWNECNSRLENYTVNIPISGNVYPFGSDSETRENVIGLNALIDKERGGLLPSGTVPNPRPFTPKGSTTPVNVSHQDFAIMGAMLAQAKDQHVMAYLYHKSVILSLESSEDIENYDVTVGFPV